MYSPRHARSRSSPLVSQPSTARRTSIELQEWMEQETQKLLQQEELKRQKNVEKKEKMKKAQMIHLTQTESKLAKIKNKEKADSDVNLRKMKLAQNRQEYV